MVSNFIAELRWRGMIHDIMPGTEEALLKKVSSGYIGFDPTADSLHIGSLVQIMILVHFQRAGHKPIALVGGATGMVGDPSGKSQERNLLDEATLSHNVACVKNQLMRFLDFSGENAAEMVNNFDWFKNMSFLDFIRDTGKHLTVNYMMSKDSVKNRLETGMSFTEFSYQLVQGYDFYHLNLHKDCIVQMGKTSPYAFYQYWLNASDADAGNFIRIFTLKDQGTIDALEKEHNEAPHLRILQKALAEDITLRVHGEDALTTAISASNILFGKSTAADLMLLSNEDFLSIFDGVPQANINKEDIENGLSIIDALAGKSGFLSSNGEARRELKANAISVNKEKIDENCMLTKSDLINGKFILIGKGKKNNYILSIMD